MSLEVIDRPDSADLHVADIRPARELESCNHLLGDRAALGKFYDENGYILLRDVLDAEAVALAREEMLAVAVKLGLIAPGDETARWTGRPLPANLEESDLYRGIARRLIEHPANLEVMEKVLGEPARAVPIVQYHLYPPSGPVTTVHQDGFFSPGVQDYKPLWVVLTPCNREVGGLALAVGQNKQGYFHNVGKPAPYPFPRDAVPDDAWATTDYMPGDLLIVDPSTPRCGMPNTSDRLRISFDTRVQSASHPSAIAATVKAVTPDTITVDAGDLGEQIFNVDADSFIRVLHPGVREKFEDFADYTKPGMRLVLVRDGARAVMLRKAAEG